MLRGVGSTLGAWRRTALCAVTISAAVLATAATQTGTSGAAPGAPAAPGQSTFNLGTGQAVAETLRANPVAGGLSFGIGIAEALAAHQNTVGTAESRSGNLGVIGLTLAGEGCDGGDPSLPKEDQPQALRVDSTEEGAAEGRSGEDPVVPGIQRFVRATTDPFAEAITESPGRSIPGAFTMGPSTTRSHSGVFGDYREAIARTEISFISIAGVIELRGLVWEAIHRTGSLDDQTGSFTIGSMTGPAGVPIPVDDPIAALAEANAVLQPLGFVIRPPAFHVDQTSTGTLSTVDSLTIAIVPSPTRDSVLGPIIGGAQPARESLFDALIEMDCGNATYITILDIVLAATGAGGEFGIELGGVQATTSELNLFSGLGALPPLPALGGSLPGLATTGAGTPGTPGTPGSVGSATNPIPAATTAEGNPIEDAVDAVSIDGERFGPMFWVGSAGMLMLLGAAEGDRRKMRRAQREIPLEA